jgi:molybdopterin-binding protein
MIRLENIQKRFQDFEIKSINLEVEKGEYFIILGPSGSGKTLLLEMIAGLVKPDSGNIKGIEDSRFGLIYQDYMLFPHMNVAQNIGYGLSIQRKKKNEIKTAVENASRELGIDYLLHRSVNNLSGGEKQRVAIARAMVLKPEVYLFDEPTAALDMSTRIKTQRLFIRLHKELHSTVIHVTHDFEEALALGDKIGLLLNGDLIQLDTPKEIFRNPATKAAADFLGYKNVFSGKIQDNRIKINGIEINTLVSHSDLAYITIRSNDIILSKEKILSSARNSFLGEVTKVIQRGSYVEVVLDVGILLYVDITYNSCQEMGVEPGSRFWVTFKTAAVKVFEH